MAHNGNVNSLLFNCDGNFLLSFGTDERLRLWNTETGTPEIKPMASELDVAHLVTACGLQIYLICILLLDCKLFIVKLSKSNIHNF